MSLLHPCFRDSLRPSPPSASHLGFPWAHMYALSLNQLVVDEACVLVLVRCIRHRLHSALISSEQPSSANSPRLVLPSRNLSTSGISMSRIRLQRIHTTW